MQQPLASRRRAFTLVELLVTIAVIGALVALLLPAVQGAREAARRSQCQNHLHQLAVALQGYVAVHKAFPVGCVDCTLPPPVKPPRLTSWQTWLLPHLERGVLFDAFSIETPAYRGENLRAGRTVLTELLCPSTDGPELPTSPGAGAFTDYGGLYGLEGQPGEAIDERHEGVLVYERAIEPRQVIDGLSKTAVVGEMLVRRVAGECEWANGHNLFAQEHTTPVNGASGLGNDLGSAHPGGALVAMADGAVRWIDDSMEQAALNATLTRDGEDEP
jgi:prepilin-type N-terminal cleavage/methylation domain-containing protein